jgi:hypothetical protein
MYIPQLNVPVLRPLSLCRQWEGGQPAVVRHLSDSSWVLSAAAAAAADVQASDRLWPHRKFRKEHSERLPKWHALSAFDDCTFTGQACSSAKRRVMLRTANLRRRAVHDYLCHMGRALRGQRGWGTSPLDRDARRMASQRPR